MNFTGLDGGSSVYQIRDIFLSDDAESTIEAQAAEPQVTTSEDLPKTGETMIPVVMAFVVLFGACTVLYVSKKTKKA